MEHAELPHRVLVTGADGKIGRPVVSELARRGVAVTALSPAWTTRSDADRVMTGDATAEDDVARAIDGVQAVIHLAALAHPDHGTPYQVYRTNTDATFNVLAQAGQRGIRRAVIASSINASGVPMNRHGVLPAYLPLDEDLPLALDDWYSLSKRSDELTAQMAASRWGMDVVAIRYPNVLRTEEIAGFGAGPAQQNAKEGWSFIQLDDAVDATILGLTAPLSGAHVVGVAADTTYMPRGTEDLLDEFLPTVPRRRRFPGRSSVVDTARARDLLGFSPRYNVE